MKRALPILLLILIAHAGWSQQQASLVDKITGFPTKFIDKANSKSRLLDEQLEKQTIKYLQRLARREQKLKRKLAKTDSTSAKALFDDAALQYEQLIQQFSGDSASITNRFATGKKYLPYVDSMQSSLAFLQQHSELLGDAKEWKDKLQGSLGQVTELQSKLQQAEQIKAFIRQRKEQIKQSLSRYTKLPKSITKQFGDFNKDIYYYTQQVNEYKELLNDPDRLTQKALGLLNRLPAFKEFMQKHGELAGLFGTPDRFNNPQSLVGLQTRQQVQQLIQTQLSAAGPNAQQLIQQNIQQAQAQLSQLKDKLNKLGGAEGGDLELPARFKPNTQKTKSFWKRLEYGSNFQSVKSNAYFPTTTDIGLSVGYKLNNKSVIGIGGSYKVGWGKDIRHINITHQGAGLRTFIDIQLKGSFYASGGYEQNYQPVTWQPISSPTGGGWEGAAWQQSGLIGISKVVSVKSKLFKKTKVQLLWDFLSYQQTPRTQALKFRVGYNF